jgi:hypothetical protein
MRQIKARESEAAIDKVAGDIAHIVEAISSYYVESIIGSDSITESDIRDFLNEAIAPIAPLLVDKERLIIEIRNKCIHGHVHPLSLAQYIGDYVRESIMRGEENQFEDKTIALISKRIKNILRNVTPRNIKTNMPRPRKKRSFVKQD